MLLQNIIAKQNGCALFHQIRTHPPGAHPQVCHQVHHALHHRLALRPPGTIPKSVIKCIIHSITLIATIAITPRSTLELHVNNNCSTPFSALRQSTAMPPLRGCTPRDKNCATNATAERRSDPAHSKRPTLCYRCNCPKAIISGALQERQKKRYR